MASATPRAIALGSPTAADGCKAHLYGVADWPLQAPRIAGTPPGNDAELVTLLSTGIWRDGKPLRPPMPQFHMTREDAASAGAYLKSLGAGPR